MSVELDLCQKKTEQIIKELNQTNKLSMNKIIANQKTNNK